MLKDKKKRFSDLTSTGKRGSKFTSFEISRSGFGENLGKFSFFGLQVVSYAFLFPFFWSA
jgi:hypothetical protein